MAVQGKKTKTGRVSVSWVIAALLIASGIIRLFGGAGEAIAREVASITPAAESSVEQQNSCVSGAAMGDLLRGLDRRKSTLESRTLELDIRERDIEAGATLVTEQMRKLVEAEVNLSALVAMAETAAEGDISQLTTVYEQMKPKEAAAIFEEMAPEFAAGFLGRMRPESAARVFAGLTPKTAYSISAILAGRNVHVPTE